MAIFHEADVQRIVALSQSGGPFGQLFPNTADPMPYGGLSFTTPAATSIVEAGAYVKGAGATTVTHQSATVDSTTTDNRIVYTGTVARHFHMVVQASISLTTGTNQLCAVQLWKYDASAASGALVAHSEAQTNIAGTGIAQITSHADIMLDENDYVEMHIANHTNTNNITVQLGYMFIMGMPIAAS